MKRILRKTYGASLKVAKKITNLDQILADNQKLKLRNEELEKIHNFGWPNGHYYSPVHTLEDLKPFKKVQKRAEDNFMSIYPTNYYPEILKESYDREDENILNGGSLWLRKLK